MRGFFYVIIFRFCNSPPLEGCPKGGVVFLYLTKNYPFYPKISSAGGKTSAGKEKSNISDL